MRTFLISALAGLLLITTGCAKKAPHYIIGVSQCSQDIWREKQNAELRMGAYLQDNVELRFAAAYDSDERQVQQIDSLIASGIDLLIVAPNQVQTISPAIDRAYDSGIPVIVFERKTNSRKYTAFMSADNYEMGRVMGNFIASQLHGSGSVLEVKGLKGSSPAIERHNGFTDALSAYPGIHILDTLQGDWTEQSAEEAVGQWLQAHPQERVDFVFGQNDRMAMGARKALARATSQAGKENSHHSSPATRYCGIDGLPDANGGIRLVRDSVLVASYIYPTHGDQLLQLAVDILDDKSYQKEVRLMSALVTHDNANVLLMQSEEMMRQAKYLDRLHEKADSYLDELDTQHTITLLAIGVIVLLIIAIVFFYRYHISMLALHREREFNSLWNLKPEDLPETPEPVEPAAPAEPEEPAKDDATLSPPEGVAASFFITRFKEAVEKRLSDSDLSVEDLAADMNLSRVQLYRKVKFITGSTPVDLLRTARLNRGYQLLLTTDMTVSEIAYQVGFTAPSYFTRCFKEKYGKLPGEVRT